jgi:hypothetical protein
MHLVLVLPEQTAAVQGATSATLPRALARLSVYATPVEDTNGLMHALLQALGEPTLAPAPLLAAGSGVPLRDAATHWLAATPVLLGIQGDDVRVAARVHALPASYAAAAIARFNAMFGDDGVHFGAVRPDAWFASMSVRATMTTTPIDSAIGQSLYAHRPTGPAARRWERFGNEIQMLLFALNDQDGTGQPAPGADGEPRPNGVWFWGGGAWPGDVATHLGHVRALAAHDDTSDAADLARGVMLWSQRAPEALPAALEVALGQSASAQPTAAPHPITLIVLPAHAEDVLATHWLAPALAALEQRRIGQLTVLAGHAPTLRWSATPPSLITRLRARCIPRAATTART